MCVNKNETISGSFVELIRNVKNTLQTWQQQTHFLSHALILSNRVVHLWSSLFLSQRVRVDRSHLGKGKSHACLCTRWQWYCRLFCVCCQVIWLNHSQTVLKFSFIISCLIININVIRKTQCRHSEVVFPSSSCDLVCGACRF